MERKIKEVQKCWPTGDEFGGTHNSFQEEFQYLSNWKVEKETKETSSSHTNLLSEPFVELLAAVKHKTFSLWSFLALSHQSGVLITLKQSWNLTTTKHALNFCCCWWHIQCMLNSGGKRLPNQLKLWATNSETKKKNKVRIISTARIREKFRNTSPFARSVFILSKKLDSKMLDSSKMKTIFSFLQPARLRTARKSSSKSAAKYLRWI